MRHGHPHLQRLRVGLLYPIDRVISWTGCREYNTFRSTLGLIRINSDHHTCSTFFITLEYADTLDKKIISVDRLLRSLAEINYLIGRTGSGITANLTDSKAVKLASDL